MRRKAAGMVAAVSVPVSADLEKGFGDRWKDLAFTIQLAIETGLAGGSIEDATGDKQRPLSDSSHAIERVQAAVEAARKTGTGFMITARAENFLRGHPDLDDTITRLQAFERAGAGVKRISLASTLHRAAMSALMDAADEVLNTGTFDYLQRLQPSTRIGSFLK